MLAIGLTRLRVVGNGGKDVGAFGGTWSEGIGWATGAGGVEEGVAAGAATFGVSVPLGLPRIMVCSVKFDECSVFIQVFVLCLGVCDGAEMIVWLPHDNESCWDFWCFYFRIGRLFARACNGAEVKCYQA